MESNKFLTEEGFVHVGERSEEEILRQEIEKYKVKHSALMEDIAKLEQKKDDAEKLTQRFQARAEKEEKKLLENERSLFDQDQMWQEQVRSMVECNYQLKVEEQKKKEQMCHLEKETEKLEAICSSGMERKMVFKGKVSDNVTRCGINAKHQIRYPIKGGTALIVFEEPSVAMGLIKKKHHKVAIDECHINVKAEPVELMVLDSLGMDMSRSPWKILISNLPSTISEDVILDKLELFFSKSKHGGGEVDGREYLADSKSAILTFTQEGVAPRLVGKKTFDVSFGGQETHQICVSPSLDGNIIRYEMKKLQCDRTVLITGIPDIKDEETLRDLLEIHFQLDTNGGGEVQKLFYCPEGKNTIVLFENDEDDLPQKE